MFNFLNLEPEVFGVDVNDLSLRIVKLKKKRKGFVLVSFNEVEVTAGVIKEGIIQDQVALIAIIKKAIATVKGKKLGTKYVVISLPEEKSFSQVIQMPPMTREELVSAVPLEAENYIPLPIENVYLDFQIMNTHQGDNAPAQKHIDLLINVIPKTIADGYVQCFKKAGLQPCVLEVESQAITRALIRGGSSPLPIIFIDLGGSNTSFIIFSGDSIRFTSSISISSNQLTDIISKKLGITPAKAEELKIKNGVALKKGEKDNEVTAILNLALLELVDQIKKYITFYHDHVSHEYFPSDGKIGKIILCGGGANLKGLPDFLSKNLDIPVEIGDPFINIIVPKKITSRFIPPQKAQSFTTAVGLALRGARQEYNI